MQHVLVGRAARRRKSKKSAACSTNTRGNCHERHHRSSCITAWSLLHFLWQGAAIAALAAAVMLRVPRTGHALSRRCRLDALMFVSLARHSLPVLRRE
jgi:hypothetical protein